MDDPLHTAVAEEELCWWLHKVHVIANDLATPNPQAFINTLRELLDSQEFTRFLWTALSYYRGNLYLQKPSPPDTPDIIRLHDRDPNYVRLPWLKVRDSDGKPIDPKAQPAIYLDAERQTDERRIQSKGSSARLIVRWLHHRSPGLSNTFSPQSRGRRLEARLSELNNCCAFITKGELLFLRLHCDDPYSYPYTTQDFDLVRQWLEDPAAPYLAGDLYPQDIERFVVEASKYCFHPQRKLDYIRDRHPSVQRLQDIMRCNPELELDILHNENILFFPAGRVYSGDVIPASMPIFCLVSFTNSNAVDLVHRSVALFDKIITAGVEYAQQIEAGRRARRVGILAGWNLFSHDLLAPLNQIRNYVDVEFDEVSAHYEFMKPLLDKAFQIVSVFRYKPARIMAEIEPISLEELIEKVRTVLLQLVHGDSPEFDAELAGRALPSGQDPVLVDPALTDRKGVHLQWHDGLIGEICIEQDIKNAFKHSQSFVKKHPEMCPQILVVISETSDGYVSVQISNPVPTAGGPIPWREELEEDSRESPTDISSLALQRLRYRYVNEMFSGCFRRDCTSQSEPATYADYADVIAQHGLPFYADHKDHPYYSVSTCMRELAQE